MQLQRNLTLSFVTVLGPVPRLRYSDRDSGVTLVCGTVIPSRDWMAWEMAAALGQKLTPTGLTGDDTDEHKRRTPAEDAVRRLNQPESPGQFSWNHGRQ